MQGSEPIEEAFGLFTVLKDFHVVVMLGGATTAGELHCDSIMVLLQHCTIMLR